MAADMTAARTWLLTILYIAAFAQLGVLTRIYLAKLFQDGCEGSWGLCLTSSGKMQHTLGSYYTDLPSNILGSFIMGMLATSTAVGLQRKKAIALLPAKSSLQSNAPLLAGLRTGFCGSLTTFSAWQLQCVLLLVGGRGRDGGQWAQALWSALIGLMTALASLVAGHHAALAVHRQLAHDVSADAKKSAPGHGGNSQQAVPDAQPVGVVLQDQQCAAELGVLSRGRAPPVHSKHAMSERSQQQLPAGSAACDQQQTAAMATTPTDAPAPGQCAGRWSAPRQPAAEQQARQQSYCRGAATVALPHDGLSSAARWDAEDGLGPQEYGPAGAEREEVEEEEEEDEAEEEEENKAESATAHGQHRRHVYTHLAAGVLCIALVAAFVTATIVDNSPSHTSRRAIWLSVLLGIPGAVLRWLLANLNFTLPGRASWLPAGTLAANSLAVAITTAVQIPVDSNSLHLWSGIWVSAIQGGFCGALSTVSTFASEVVQMLREGPAGFRRAYAYMALSIALAWLLGIVIYGSAHWS